MKIRCNFKDPDTMPDAVVDAFSASEKPSGISDEEWGHIRQTRALEAQHAIARKWMEYSEYLMVEFDTDSGTATVIPRNEQ
jgi:hypothetical protein